MKNLIVRFVKDQSGATAIEYGIIAALIAVAAAWQPASASGPNDASWPVNGLNAATVRVEFFAAPDCTDEHAAVVETARTAAAATIARARVRRDLREVTSGYRTPFPHAPRVLP